MKKLYTITTVLAIDDRNRAAVIEKARRLFTTNILKVWDKDKNGMCRTMTAQERLARKDCISTALLDIMSSHPELNDSTMEIVEIRFEGSEDKDGSPQQGPPGKNPTSERTGARSEALSEDPNIVGPSAQDAFDESEADMYVLVPLAQWRLFGPDRADKDSE